MEDIIKTARERKEKYLKEKIEQRREGEGTGKHLFIWRKRAIEILDKLGKTTIDNIAKVLIKNYPEEHQELSEDEIRSSIKSTLKGLLKKERLENLRGIKVNVLYGQGYRLKNSGQYWWIENIKKSSKQQMREVLDIFHK